jgi:type I restriction enzyme, S subunit
MLSDVLEIQAADAPSRCRQVVQAGDTVFSTVRPYLEKIAYVDGSLDGEFASTGFCVLRPGPRLLPSYLYYFSISPPMLGQVLPYQKGVSYPAVLDKEVRTTAIPIPPLDEQRRIVELLEDHLSRLDAADAYLDAAQRRGATLKDQVLDSELTLKEVENVSLGDLLIVKLGNGKSVPTEDGGFPVLRLTALRDGRIDLAERKAGAWSATEATRFLVQRGDFFIARGNGSLRLVGRGGLVTDDPDPVAYPDTLIRARPDPATISPEFLALVWNAPVIRRQIERVAKTTAGIYKINQKDVAAVQVPVPALIDQERIVRAVTAVRESMAKLVSEIDRSRTRGTALRRSLLAAAFSGQFAAEMATA